MPIPNGSYDTTQRVTGSFTITDVLVSDLNAASITPTEFSFSDGRTVLSSTLGLGQFEVAEFIISTDSEGGIIDWQIRLGIGLGATPIIGDQGFLISTQTIRFQEDFGGIDELFLEEGKTFVSSDFAFIQNSPGVWTSASTIPIPEPSSLSLLALGLAGLDITRRKRSKA